MRRTRALGTPGPAAAGAQGPAAAGGQSPAVPENRVLPAQAPQIEDEVVESIGDEHLFSRATGLGLVTPREHAAANHPPWAELDGRGAPAANWQEMAQSIPRAPAWAGPPGWTTSATRALLSPAPAAPLPGLGFMDHARATAAAVMAAGFPTAHPAGGHAGAHPGHPALLPSAAKAGPPAPPGFSTGALVEAPVQRRLADVLDQSDPGTYVALSRQEVHAAMELHVAIMGARPQPEQEPSPEQLGALRAKLRAGDPPAVDFGIWGSHDRRHARDRQNMALVWIEGGGLQPRRLQGPATFEAWDLAWGVFAAAMLSLGAAAPGALARYRHGVRDLNTLYPELWGVVSRADHAMRFEQWSRMAFESHPGGDWSTILVASAFWEDGSRQGWWTRQVVMPAQSPRPHCLVNALEGYTPRGATLAVDQRAASARTQAPARALTDEPPAKAARPSKAARARARAAAGQVAAPAAPAPPAQPAAAAAANPCYKFNAGKCKGPTCPMNFDHRCVICGERHAAVAVPACKAQVDKSGRPLRK